MAPPGRGRLSRVERRSRSARLPRHGRTPIGQGGRLHALRTDLRFDGHDQQEAAIAREGDEGDLLVFDIAGAYSESLFTRFNGIEPPAIHYVDDLLNV